MEENKKNEFDPADMPDKKAFERKEVYQHPQPADNGKPLDKSQKDKEVLTGKAAEKTSKQDGLNEEKSEGTAGAFEGFEDQQQSLGKEE